MKNDLSVKDFFLALKEYMFSELNLKEYCLSPEDEEKIKKISEQVYSQWNWNYGASPPYNVRKSCRIENCGTIEVLIDVGKEGVIKNITFYGDFFSNKDLSELTGLIIGQKLNYNTLSELLKETDISQYFINLDRERFLSLLVE